MAIDNKAWGIEPPVMMNANFVAAMQVIRAAGWDVVPSTRLKEVTVGGNIQAPPLGAPQQGVVDHWAAVYAHVAKAMAMEFLKEKLVEIHRNPAANDLVELKMKVLVIAPQHTVVETTEKTGPRRVGPAMDVGMPPPPEGGWPTTNEKTDFKALPNGKLDS